MSEAQNIHAWRIAPFLAPLLGFVALAGWVAAGGAGDFDSGVRAFTSDLVASSLTSAMLALTLPGSVIFVTAVSIAAFAGFYVSGRKSSAWLLALTMAGSAVLENGLKFALHRARPEPFFGFVAPESYSFPSGHALFSACLYVAIAWHLTVNRDEPLRRLAIWTLALALIGAIGFSRVYLGFHYPTDVLGGWLVAAAWLGAVRVGVSDRMSRGA